LLEATSDFSRETATQLAEGRLIPQLKARSTEAWAQVYDAYYGRLHHYVWAVMRSPAEADDIAATVFVRALTGIDGYLYCGKPFAAWLFRIARNVINERRRKQYRERSFGALRSWFGHPEGPDLPDNAGLSLTSEHESAVQARIDLHSALAKLSRGQREVILLRHVSGLTAAEAGGVLGKSSRAVYYLEARGLIRLRELLT
jgi:RNA polymerase sigma-70 factor (ECF subfamily)